jgi:tagatose 1,6-diphosphate aldolase GatY/KbaY
MLADTGRLLIHARENGYAVGAFNIYNLEGATAVVQAAEEQRSPVILQLLPSALQIGGRPLVIMCLEMGRTASIPVAVHLDHCSSVEIITLALESGCSSVMADGSALDYQANITFTLDVVEKAGRSNAAVEAELGRLSGEEDGLRVAEYQACMTDPEQAADFARKTSIAALAVCIGNMHGSYPRPPRLDFERLAAIARRVSVPLVLHGTSGLPDAMIHQAMALGVCKFNVNTEIRSAYIKAMATAFSTSAKIELIDLMCASVEAMKMVVRSKIKLFCSADKASSFTKNY